MAVTARVIRAGFRYGDYANMAIIELVDRDINAKKIDIIKKVGRRDTKIHRLRKQKSPKIKIKY